MIKYGLLAILLSVYLSATSSPCGMSKGIYLDLDNKIDDIVCQEMKEDACSCEMKTSLGIKHTFTLEHKQFSEIGFQQYQKMPKGRFLVEKGYLGYAEHHFFKYEPKFKGWFIEKIETFRDTMNPESISETKIELFKKIRWNIDGSKFIITDKIVLKELSHFFNKKINKPYLFETNREFELTSKNVEAYNNIAHYLNNGRVDGSEIMLKRIVKAFPSRAVAYYNLAEFYENPIQFTKLYESYMKYIFYMIKQKKEKKIPKKLNGILGNIYNVVRKATKKYDYLTLVKWGDLTQNATIRDDLVFFVESKEGRTQLFVCITDEKVGLFLPLSVNTKLPRSYMNLPSKNKAGEGDYPFLSKIIMDDNLLTLKFSQINYHTVFRGVDNQYKFQYRNRKIKLIGAELFDYSRGRGDGFKESINYLTRQKESYEVEDLTKRVGKSKWSTLKKYNLIKLEEFVYEDVY